MKKSMAVRTAALLSIASGIASTPVFPQAHDATTRATVCAKAPSWIGSSAPMGCAALRVSTFRADGSALTRVTVGVANLGGWFGTPLSMIDNLNFTFLQSTGVADPLYAAAFGVASGDAGGTSRAWDVQGAEVATHQTLSISSRESSSFSTNYVKPTEEYYEVAGQPLGYWNGHLFYEAIEFKSRTLALASHQSSSSFYGIAGANHGSNGQSLRTGYQHQDGTIALRTPGYTSVDCQPGWYPCFTSAYREANPAYSFRWAQHEQWQYWKQDGFTGSGGEVAFSFESAIDYDAARLFEIGFQAWTPGGWAGQRQRCHAAVGLSFPDCVITDLSTQVAPEPSTFVLTGFALFAGLVAHVKRRRETA